MPVVNSPSQHSTFLLAPFIPPVHVRFSHCVLSSFFPLTPSISSPCSYNEDSYHLQCGSHRECEGQVDRNVSHFPTQPCRNQVGVSTPWRGYSRYSQTEQNEPNMKSYQILKDGVGKWPFLCLKNNIFCECMSTWILLDLRSVD